MNMTAPWELDFNTDAIDIQKAGTRCPVHHCEAHQLRHAPCGDDTAPYGAVHVGRVKAHKRAAATQQRRINQIERATDCTTDAAILTHYIVQTMKDGIECGIITGKPTRAMREVARARKRQ